MTNDAIDKIRDETHKAALKNLAETAQIRVDLARIATAVEARGTLCAANISRIEGLEADARSSKRLGWVATVISAVAVAVAGFFNRWQ